jgi:quaternary ammonium compound-resistance protein SugE
MIQTPLKKKYIMLTKKEITMVWVLVCIAGLFEISWAIGLRYTDGFTKFWPSLWTGVSLIFSMALLGFALKKLPVGTAYTIWTGIGAVGTVILGIILFGESVDLGRIISITFIIAGMIGLKLMTP